MGCDIHVFVEERVGLEWVIVAPPMGDTEWRESFGKWLGEGNPYELFEPFKSLVSWFDERQYALFSKLANVRNHREPIVPISEPRGIPSDLCKEIQEEFDEEGENYHSHTWFYLMDLRENLAVELAEFVEFRNFLDEVWSVTKNPLTRIIIAFDN